MDQSEHRRMKSASYREAVEWIAINDEAGSGHDEAEIADYITTIMVAHLFRVDAERVARDVLRYRGESGATPRLSFRRRVAADGPCLIVYFQGTAVGKIWRNGEWRAEYAKSGVVQSISGKTLPLIKYALRKALFGA